MVHNAALPVGAGLKRLKLDLPLSDAGCTVQEGKGHRQTNQDGWLGLTEEDTAPVVLPNPPSPVRRNLAWLGLWRV